MPPLIRKIEPGDVIGRCRTIRELGRGGVGTVYLATHQTLQIEVALKVLSPSLSMDNPALAERFIREAQMAARIRHPNVIAVMDAAHDEATGLYYIVMEYVGGGSLSWHLRHGPLPEAKAVAIVTGVAHALVIAEENQIVHRDIKPDNIILDLRGTAKLADLGLAKQAIDSRTSLTLGGSFMGTPAYMSPEQARDAKVADTRDDIYSLGASFYECLTGQPPFQGETPYNIMSELLTKPSPKPSEARPDLSRGVDAICCKMMAKTRALRYADARALLQDLQTWQTYGDTGLDRLEATALNHDSVVARDQARIYGIETSADGVYVPETLEDDETGPIVRPGSTLKRPRRGDPSVFLAAALLIALVTMAALVLAWSKFPHPLTALKAELAGMTGAAVAAPVETNSDLSPVVVIVPAPVKPIPHPAPLVKPVVETNPSPRETPPPPAEMTATPTAPVALPVDPAELTNSAPETSEAIPATPAIPDSAFVARSLAESVLAPSPTGHADLLKIVGKRDSSPELSPTTWIFYFYDKSAAGNARIISVNNRQVVKNGEDIVDALAPFHDQDILPESTLVTDSSQAMEIAQGLIPGVKPSSCELSLAKQKNSVPMWKVTLWGKDEDGEEHKLGDATILSENGIPISKNLKP